MGNFYKDKLYEIFGMKAATLGGNYPTYQAFPSCSSRESDGVGREDVWARKSQSGESKVAEDYDYVRLWERAEFRSAEKVEEGMALGRLGGAGLERDHSEYLLLISTKYGR